MPFSINLKGLFFLLFILIVRLGNCQSVTIIDAFTQRPLPNVVVISDDNKRYCTSNSEGQFDTAVFRPSDDLIFQLMGYETRKLSFTELLEKNGIVSLFFDEKKLDEIILSVARTAAQSKKIAEKVSVINKMNIEQNTPTTGANLLLLSPGIRLQESQAGGGSPVLRGFEANRVLLVVDGIRMNNGIYRSGHLQNAITVDPLSIDRVEVIFGSSAVGYGSDALGGVIHYYTKTPRINNPKTFNSRFSSQINSAREAISHHVETEASFKNWASLTSVSYASFGNITMGKNRSHGYEQWGLVPLYSKNNSSAYFDQPSTNPTPNKQLNTGYSQVDVLQKLVFKLPRENQLILNFQWSNSSDIPRFDKLNEYREGTLRFAEWNYGPQKRLLFSPTLKLFPQKRLLYKGTITGGIQSVGESRIVRRFNSLLRETQQEDVSVFSLNGDFEMQKKDRSSFSYGFELVKNKITSNAFSQSLYVDENSIVGLGEKQPIPTRYPSGGSSYTSSAIYGNFRYDLNPKTSLSLGARYTETKLAARWVEEALIDSSLGNVGLFNSALTGSASLAYRPFNAWKINLLLSSGFRSPNIDDLGKIRENNGMLLVPNPALNPEYVNTIDGGVTYANDQFPFQFNLRFYYSHIHNYIGRSLYFISTDASTESDASVELMNEILFTQANINLGSANIYGLSLEGALKISEQLNATGSLSFTKANNNPIIGPLPSILPYFGKLELAYKRNKLSLLLRHRFSSAKDPETFSSGGEDGLEETPVLSIRQGEVVYAGNPKWSTSSLLANYQVFDQLRLNFAVENITDEHYRTFASGISAPGRSFIIGGAFDF